MCSYCGREFISNAKDEWAYERRVELDVSRPRTPSDNARVESLNGRLRQECSNARWLLSLEDAQATVDTWRNYDNETRRHSALDCATPAQCARRCRQLPAGGASTGDGNSYFRWPLDRVQGHQIGALFEDPRDAEFLEP